MLEDDLRKEIAKWTEKIGKERNGLTYADKKGKNFLDNIDAYVSDSRHFMEKHDLVRSFEALIWAWAWLEIGKELGILKRADVQLGKL